MDVMDFCYSLRAGELDEQITEMKRNAEAQLAFTHPLKPALQAEEHRLGEHNKKAVEMLNDLKQHLLSLYPDD